MSMHFGVVRSFDLGGTGTGGRRWAGRCSCGALATTGAWHDALAFVTNHLQATVQPNGATKASQLTPDLRGVECWRPVAVGHNGNGHTPSGPVVRRPLLRLLSAIVRGVIGALRSL